MALPSTLHRFAIDLSDVDRGVYESLEVRLVRHPSETVAYALTRMLAYCLEYGPGVELGPGLCNGDEPALRAIEPDGTLTTWIDVGAPAAERLHRAAKRVPEVAVYTNRRLDRLRQAWSGTAIHRAEEIRVCVVPESLLAALEPTFGRNNAWAVLRTEGTVYVTVGSDTFEAHVETHTAAGG